MRARRLTIYLMRDDVQEFADALDEEKTPTVVPLAEAANLIGQFHYVEPTRRTPDWVSYIEPLLADDLDDLESSSTAGLLLLRVSGRTFALTFGHGRWLLDLSKIEHQFGLRVTLNRVDPSQLRSLDTKAFQDMMVSTNTQVSRAADLPVFGVDVTSDILRAATGTPRDTTVTTRISGADPVVLNAKVSARELPDLCADLLAAFGEEHYKADFGWIDQLSLVQESRLVHALDEQLVAELISGDVGTTHLAMPDVINWEDVDVFTIEGAGHREYEDLDLDAYLADLGDARIATTLGKLESRRVGVRYSRSGEVDSKWNLYKCLVSEQRVNDHLYALIEGRWFKVAESLVEEVDQFADALPTARVSLIPAHAGEHEDAYNKRLAASSPGHLLNLDAQIKRPGGAASGIEFCDVLSDQGDLIHVKRKVRSATLSHLFTQGSVSATTFLRDGTYRDELRKHIETHVPADERARWLALVPPSGVSVDQGQYTVTYAVVANSSRAGTDWLPFFSKLSLMQHGRQLSTLGYAVALSRVSVS